MLKTHQAYFWVKKHKRLGWKLNWSGLLKHAGLSRIVDKTETHKKWFGFFFSCAEFQNELIRIGHGPLFCLVHLAAVLLVPSDVWLPQQSSAAECEAITECHLWSGGCAEGGIEKLECLVALCRALLHPQFGWRKNLGWNKICVKKIIEKKISKWKLLKISRAAQKSYLWGYHGYRTTGRHYRVTSRVAPCEQQSATKTRLQFITNTVNFHNVAENNVHSSPVNACFCPWNRD